jgi:hypothetical protein
MHPSEPGKVLNDQLTLRLPPLCGLCVKLRLFGPLRIRPLCPPFATLRLYEKLPSFCVLGVNPPLPCPRLPTIHWLACHPPSPVVDVPYLRHSLHRWGIACGFRHISSLRDSSFTHLHRLREPSLPWRSSLCGFAARRLCENPPSFSSFLVRPHQMSVILAE